MATVGDGKVARVARLMWVPIADMKVNPAAQREFKESQAERYAANFDFEGMGFPVLNHRDGNWYIVDGQHRIAALKMIGYADQKVQCECFEGLTEAQEADLFLTRDDRRKVDSFERFQIGVTAGRETETDVNRIVKALGLCVSRSEAAGAIGSASTLVRLYERGGPKTLSRALRIIRDGIGEEGFDQFIIGGVGLLCQRYNGQLKDDDAIAKLSSLRKPVSTIYQKAGTLMERTGSSRQHATAAAVVEVLNSGKGGKKLPSWFKDDA